MRKYRKWKPKNFLNMYDCDKLGIMHKSHSCSYLIYHFAINPKYRKKSFDDLELVEKLSYHIVEVCHNRGWPIHKLSIEMDHVHLELQLPPTISPMKAMQDVKGNTSRMIRFDYPEFQWSKGYWVGTVGKANKDIIDKYIEGQGVNVI